MKSNNYEVIEAGETITFRGIVERSLSQAFFLTFCTAIGFASLALVLQIQFQDLGKLDEESRLKMCERWNCLAQFVDDVFLLPSNPWNRTA